MTFFEAAIDLLNDYGCTMRNYFKKSTNANIFFEIDPLVTVLYLIQQSALELEQKKVLIPAIIKATVHFYKDQFGPDPGIITQAVQTIQSCNAVEQAIEYIENNFQELDSKAKNPKDILFYLELKNSN